MTRNARPPPGSATLSDAALRLTLGPIQNPVRGLLQGLGFALVLVLGADLTGRAGEARAALLVFVLGHAGLFTVSALYHCGPWPPAWKQRLQRLDHSMIYVKIAATLTPIVVLSVDDWRRPALLTAAWAIAAAGIAQKLLIPSLPEKASVPVQLVQALLVLPVVAPFAARFPGTPPLLLAFGTACYASGALAFLTQRPRLWPRWFSFHEVFHVLVVLGSAAYSVLLLRSLEAGF